MNDHNLDDLIIDNIEPKNGKTKNLLTIIALLIVVLIIAIVLTKIILKEPDQPLSIEENITEMISPELTLQNTQNIQKVDKDTTLSTIIEEEPSETVKMPKEEPKVEQPTKIEEPEALKKEVVEIIKKPANILKEIPKIKKEVKVPKVKPVIKKVKKETKKVLPKEIYYIQLGSYNQAPNPRFLSIIKNNGFAYKIVVSGKTQKLRVGPYKTRKAADEALIKVRDRINKSAFIVKSDSDA